MSPPSLSHIVINLAERENLRTGADRILVRLHVDDKRIVDAAAAALSLTQADLHRLLLVKGSAYVLSQLGLPFPTALAPD